MAIDTHSRIPPALNQPDLMGFYGINNVSRTKICCLNNIGFSCKSYMYLRHGQRFLKRNQIVLLFKTLQEARVTDARKRTREKHNKCVAERIQHATFR